MNLHTFQGFSDELRKIAGNLPAGLSMAGLGGLVALEGANAMNKKKSGKERAMAGAGAAATGSILAGEAIHNKGMLQNGIRRFAGKLVK